MTRWFTFAAAAALCVPVLAEQAATKVVYVSVLAEDGSPAKDLTAADFVVKENGKTREIVKVEPAPWPIQIALLVDDNGSGIFRAGLGALAQALQGRAEFSVRTVTGQTIKLLDYSADVAKVQDAISKLGPRGATNDGGQLLEAINDAARELEQREAKRSAILVFTVGGDEQSTRDSKQVLAQLQKSGAMMTVFEFANSAIRPNSTAQTPADLMDSSMNLGEVTGDGTKQSGGRLTRLVATAGFPQGLQQILNDIVGQYAVSYVLPASDKPSGKMDVQVKRKGVKLLAPTKVPQR
jgi:VWFA-related protein